MKLNSKIFLITNSQNEEINVEGRDVAIIRNGEKLPTKLFDIFKHLEFDDGEIYGNSLLSYYIPQEDGSLAVEGSRVQLIDEKSGESIMVKGLKKPGIHDNGSISFEAIKEFSELFQVAKPDEVFTDLSADEKQGFISAREVANTQNEQARAAQEQETQNREREEANKAEAALRASIDPQFVLDNNGYASVQGFYAGVGSKEYTNGPYHLFHSSDPEQERCILIKRGADWWEELKPEMIETIEETEKTFKAEFKDNETIKKAELNIETGTLTITDK